MSAIPDWIYDDLRDYSTSATDIKTADICEFEALLARKPDENACQAFLATHPAILAAFGRSGHGEWVIPKPRFGGAYVPDFLACHGTSGGLFWTLVELESPRHRPFNADGTFAKPLRTAIDQIKRWRIWIEQNIDLVQRERARGGLGFFDLRSRSAATIVIGRRLDYPPHFNDLRRLTSDDSDIAIMSYDGLLDHPKTLAAFWDRAPEERLNSMFPGWQISVAKREDT
jgi:hypothetical protein